MLSVVMLSVVILSVVTLSVVMLGVVVPLKMCHNADYLFANGVN